MSIDFPSAAFAASAASAGSAPTSMRTVASAPSADAVASAASEMSTASTCVLFAKVLATRTLERPTPPAPNTATDALSFNLPCSTTARYAVVTRHPTAAAAANETFSGMWHMFRSAWGMATYSAKPPHCVNPGCCCFSHVVGLELSHSGQAPQDSMKGTATASPTLNFDDDEPDTSTISPDNSWPGTKGRPCEKTSESCPLHPWWSLRHTPHARTRRMTPPPPPTPPPSLI
mmetsp:Transcript_15949/g.40566  ORF Transcript_15949/g.40566 Transcript_15949/m.40566 type:complete len:231 (+) Transcript_15949:557-1249(+)